VLLHTAPWYQEEHPLLMPSPLPVPQLSQLLPPMGLLPLKLLPLLVRLLPLL
jgi:hypothetical protein